MQYIVHYDSPLGWITLAGDGESLTGLWFDKQKYFMETCQSVHNENDLPVFEQTKNWLDIYFSGHEPDFTPPLDVQGSDFRIEICRIMLEIPFGSTMTYGEIAKKIAEKRGIARMSAQAVGGAVGHNPISIIVPCHRVIGAHGNLTGYGGGIDRKIKLLELEGMDMTSLFRPKHSTAP